jgi:NTP pyrophosphatase (non-canonical NTP hydrolase)
MMELEKIIHRAMDLRRQYEKRETELYGSPTTSVDIAEGFAGDVKNLVKLVLAENGQGTIANSKEKLEAQLAHCLWSVVVLAEMHKVDIATAFMEAMDRLENHLLETQE